MRIPVLVVERLYIPRLPELREMLDTIRAAFVYQNPEYWKKKKQGYWVGNLTPNIQTWAYTTHPTYGPCLTLPRGGTKKLRSIARDYDVQLSFIDNRFQLPPITNLENDVELWPEQERLSKIVFAKENCLLRSPTGSGKTESLLKITEWILKNAGPVLIIVWEGSRQSGLMSQWIERIAKRFGIRQTDVGIIGDGIKRVRPITVGMQQTLLNCGRRYIHDFGGVICDEVQRFAAPTFQKVIDIFPARYRIGASADETRKDGKEWLIHDAFGEVAGEIEKAVLIAKEKIHAVAVRIVPTEWNFYIHAGRDRIPWIELPSDAKDFNALLDRMTNDEMRNDLIWDFIRPCLEAGHTCMIATHRVDHAKYWDARIRKSGFTSGLLLGGGEYAAEFGATVTGLRQRKIAAGIGTVQKIGQGHDIPQWNRGFILTPLAGNKQQFEQLLGRLRRTCEGKTDAVAYYFWDNEIYPHDKRRLAKLYPGITYVWVDDEFLQL